MRTIIINTLGEEAPQQELLFLPFQEDQLVWLNTNMGGIGACVDRIEELYKAQDKRRDYRLMVLADLGGYAGLDKDVVKSCYCSILNAYINVSLFQPLADEKKIPPRSLCIVYVISRIIRAKVGLPENYQYDYILGFSDDQPFDTLELVRLSPDGREEHLDVTGLFRDKIEGWGVNKAHESAELLQIDIGEFRNDLPRTLERLQKCRYTPSGSMQYETIPIQAEEFIPKCAEPSLIWLDIQLNLSELLARQSRMPRKQIAELKLIAHSEEQLAVRVQRGLRRVQMLLEKSPDQKYYPLENRLTQEGWNLETKIWKALLEKKDLLPGVVDADARRNNQTSAKNDGLGIRIEKAWLRMGQEKKRFESLYSQLLREYDPERAREQQQTIMNICAEEFRKKRSEELAAALVDPPESETVAMPIPELNTQELEERLHQAQASCTAMAADKLEDYLDLRQEAEDIRAEYLSSSKIWMPDSGSVNTRNFITYSLVLAALFLVQMMLPYLGITLGQSGVELSRYIHFIASIAVFAGLYALGVLLWLRQMCRELSEHSQAMKALIYRSSERRRKSVEKLVRVYGKDLPDCAILYVRLQELRKRNGLNLQRYTRYRAHMELLKRGEKLLKEMGTEYQLSSEPLNDKDNSESIIRGINYQTPANDKDNIPYYMLLSDEWGDGVC